MRPALRPSTAIGGIRPGEGPTEGRRHGTVGGTGWPRPRRPRALEAPDECAVGHARSRFAHVDPQAHHLLGLPRPGAPRPRRRTARPRRRAGLFPRRGPGRIAPRRLPAADLRPRPGHPWNRLFAALAIRHSHLPSRRGGPSIERIEGGDRLDFLGWPGTTYWSEPATARGWTRCSRSSWASGAAGSSPTRCRHVVFQRDLWAAFDFLVGQNIEQRRGPGRPAAARRPRPQARRRDRGRGPAPRVDRRPAGQLCGRDRLGPVRPRAPARPDAGLPAPRACSPDPEEWAEIDFFRPDIHEDIEGRFVTLHTRRLPRPFLLPHLLPLPGRTGPAGGVPQVRRRRGGGLEVRRPRRLHPAPPRAAPYPGRDRGGPGAVPDGAGLPAPPDPDAAGGVGPAPRLQGRRRRRRTRRPTPGWG